MDTSVTSGTRLGSNKSALNKLRAWFEKLQNDFPEEVDANKVDLIVAAAEHQSNSRLTSYLGSCTNGIAFLTDRGTVLKFTIDAKEAALWGQIWGWSHPNMALAYGSWQLVSRTTGPLIVYLVAVEYVPHPVDKKLADELTTAMAGVYKTGRPAGRPVSKRELTLSHLRALRAVRDPRVEGIIDLVISLADDVGVNVYDLQPDNFRMTDDGIIKMIDPSTPSGVRATPDELVFEAIWRGLGTGHIIY